MKAKSAMTLDRVLSRHGLASRTAAREAIRAGRIKVNGRVVRDLERWVDLKRDIVHLDGRRLRAARKIYLLFYKPKGVITSHGDPGGRETVYDYLGENRQWVSPVGRLDKDTSGLLLLTNDTEFADFVTNPQSRVPKTYLVKVSGLMSDAVIAQLAAGVEMKRGDRAQPESVHRVEDRGKYTWLEVVLAEGKNREVRRMVEAVSFKALKLVRTRIGPLTLDGLEVGRWRVLTLAEVAALRGVQKRGVRLMGRKPKRLLLLLVDVVGYSRMDSSKQVEVVKHLRSTWDGMRPRQNGRMLRPPLSPISIGDGFIFCGEDDPESAEFFLSFIVKQVQAESRLPDDQRYATRFALNEGECLLDQRLVLGHPMNELARLAACAREGQLVASNAFFQRLQHYVDVAPLLPLREIYFDKFLVYFKHDRWNETAVIPQLAQGGNKDRIVYNFLLPAKEGLNTASFDIGNALPPENAIWYTGENNYHHRYQFAGAGFMLRSEQELFRYHCTAFNEKLMCLAFRSHYVRLPFTVEYAAHPSIRCYFLDVPAPRFYPPQGRSPGKTSDGHGNSQDRKTDVVRARDRMPARIGDSS